MAIGDPYVTASELKSYLQISGSGDDTLILAAATAASRQIEQHCARQFNTTASATARVYRPQTCTKALVDDFSTTSGLIIKTDTGDNGTYDTTWASTDYVLEPFGGLEEGMTGFPYRVIKAVEARTFPRSTRPRLEVTAQWGWAAVPDPVKQATYILAAQLFNLKNAPLGVAGFGEFGVVRVRDIPQVAALVDPFRHPLMSGPFIA